MPLNQAAHAMPYQVWVEAQQPTAMFYENFPRAQAVIDCVIGATTLLTCAKIGVYPGDTLTKISVCSGATAGGTGTHNFFAIYSDITVPALLAQTPDVPIVTPAANTVIVGTFATPFIVPAQTFSIWVGFLFTGGTVPTLIGRTANLNATGAAALNTAIGSTNGISVTATGAAGATAPATMASLTQLAGQPYFLIQ